MISSDDITPEMGLRIIEKYRISSSLISLYAMALMLHSPIIETVDLSSMKRLYCGGSILSRLHGLKMNEYLPNGGVYVVYGLSEVPGYISVGTSTEAVSNVGNLAPGHRVRVLDENGNTCGPNMEGELLVHAAIPFMPYWNNEVQSKELLTDDGWVRTGDIGRFDNNGLLYITDRKKEMIKYKGDNVSPALVENIVLSMEGVKSVCIVGVFNKNLEEKPTAIVVQDNQYDVTEQTIQANVDGKINVHLFIFNYCF